MATTTDLIGAAQRGDNDGVLRCLQRGADIEGTVQRSQTALYLAITNNHAEVAITLLEKGAKPNRRSTLKCFTLLMYSIRNDLTNVASLLIDKGARVNDCDVSGFTALMFTSRRGHEDLALKLIKHGAKVNARDHQNYTYLHWASMYNHPAVLRVLLANGADINAVNELGETALDIAKEKHHSEIEAILKANGQNIGTFREMRQLIETLQSRVVGMEESRRENNDRLAASINELENEKNVMETKIVSLLRQNSTKDRQLTELKTLVVGMGDSRRVNDERLAGRINKLENGKNVMETKIENLLRQNSIKERQLTELKTLVVGKGDSRRVNDERLAGRIIELENTKYVMEIKIENILKQNSIKDRQLTELKTLVDGMGESRRVNDERLAGRIKELENGKNVTETKIENLLMQNSIKDRQLTELKTLVVGMGESRRVNDERLAGRIKELENGKNVMETKIENLLMQNSIKDRQLTELKTLLVGMGESRRANDERLVGRINELENGKNVMETKIENLLEQNSIKDRQLTELKTLLVGMRESRRVNDERLVGRINELENGKNVMETKIKNILKQNSTKDRQLTELKTRVEGIDESRRKNDESLVGRLDELQSEKSVMESKIENLLWQNSVKDRQLTELKTQVEQKLIQNNQTELETRLENLRVELDEMKRENRLKVEQLDQLKNATEALAANGITQSPKSSFSRVLSENSTSSSDIAEKRSDSKNLTEKVRILETKLNDSEQDKMVDTIEISGIEERPSENLNIVLFAVARALDLPFPTDLVLVSRQPAFVPEVGKRPRVILVKFKKAETARNWLKTFKDKRPTGIVASELDASFKGDKIFVNQKLTSFNKKLLRRVKEFAKGKEYQYVWVQDGKILLRKNQDSPIIRIKTNNDIPSH